MWTRLSIKEDTKLKLVNECVEDFLKHNPEFESMKITHDFILNKVIRYYLDN